MNTNMGRVLFSKYPCQPSPPLFVLISYYSPSFLGCSSTAALLLLLEHARHSSAPEALHMLFLLPGTFPLNN